MNSNRITNPARRKECFKSIGQTKSSKKIKDMINQGLPTPSVKR